MFTRSRYSLLAGVLLVLASTTARANPQQHYVLVPVPAQTPRAESCDQPAKKSLFGLFRRDKKKDKVPCGCWGHHDAFRCGSLRSELRFIFGSCRAFFGEDCLKAGPPGFEHEYRHKTHPPHGLHHIP